MGPESRVRFHLRWLLAAPAILALSVSGASTKGEAGARGSVVWPPPPAQPFIAYVQSISRPSDAGVRASTLGRIAGWLVGATRGNESLERPFGVGLDENDNLCLTDTSARAVCYFDRRAKKWLRFDRLGNMAFSSPVAVARRGGTFFVADSGLGSILAFDERPRLLFQVTNRLERPSGLAISGDLLLVADSQRHRIVVFDLHGTWLSEFGERGTGEGEFNFPTHIWAAPSGRICVTDSMNNRIQVFGTDGKFKCRIGSIGDSPGHFSRPKGVATDTLGHLYVVDALFDNIQMFDPEGRLLLTIGERGSGPGQFWLPSGIAISRQNEIFVADSYNRRIQVLKYIGPP